MSLSEELKDQIKEDLKRHEGVKYEVYLDHLGLPTAGVGHLLHPMSDYEVGDKISKEQVDEWFEEDLSTAITDACAVFLNFGSLPDDVKRVCVNMAFNIGRSRLSKFKNMIRYVNEGNFLMAANEMIDSKWYTQVGNRSKELVDIMKEAKV